MEQISLYLEKYKRFGFKTQIVKETLIAIIKKKFGVELTKDDIDVKNGEVRINISGPLKSEIFINKDSIKEELNNSLEANNKAHSII